MIFSQLLLHLVVILSAVSISNPLPHNQFQNPSLSSLIISGGSTSTKDDPFLNLSKLFEGTKYSQQEVHKALRNIAGNQATLKNMDGVTHQLQNSMGKRYLTTSYSLDFTIFNECIIIKLIHTFYLIAHH